MELSQTPNTATLIRCIVNRPVTDTEKRAILWTRFTTLSEVVPETATQPWWEREDTDERSA